MAERTSSAPPSAPKRRTPLGPAIGAGFLAFVVVAVAASALAATSQPSSIVVPAVGGVEFVNISATTQFTFVPAAVTVTPGDSIHLVVTQLATVTHNFVLSAVANFSFPSGDTNTQLNQTFNTQKSNGQPPLVNLTLGPTTNSRYFANFTAPAVGTYEFVCLQPSHFSSGMHGTLTSGSSASSGGSSSTALYEEIAILVVVVVVIVAVVAAMRMRSRPKPPTGPGAASP